MNEKWKTLTSPFYHRSDSQLRWERKRKLKYISVEFSSCAVQLLSPSYFACQTGVNPLLTMSQTFCTRFHIHNTNCPIFKSFLLISTLHAEFMLLVFVLVLFGFCCCLEIVWFICNIEWKLYAKKRTLSYCLGVELKTCKSNRVDFCMYILTSKCFKRWLLVSNLTSWFKVIWDTSWTYESTLLKLYALDEWLWAKTYTKKDV